MKKFNLLVYISIAVILILIVYNICFSYEDGTYSTSYYYNPVQPSKPVRKPQKKSRREEEVRQIMQSLFNKPFLNVRPDWLKNPITGQNLELDVYCPELKIAVEYHGRQHYEHVPFFHKTQADFRAQQYRDDIKRRLCREHDIILIEVPYSTEDLETFLLSELEKNNITL